MTYVERGRVMNAEAMASRLKEDAERCEVFKCEMERVAGHSVSAANVTRELGQSFEEYWLPADAAAAENYFNATYRKVLGIEFKVFQWIISTARRLPEKCESAEDAYPAQKQLWLAGGLIEEGHREEPQAARFVTPVVAVFDRLGKARVALDRTFEDVSGWDEETRTGVREEIKKHREWLGAIELKIAE